MDLSVFFAGTARTPVPTRERGLPALLVRAGGDRLLFGCGEGTQRQLMRSVGLMDLDAVFLPSLEPQDWLGLPGLLKTFDLRDRDKPLALYGPPRLDRLRVALEPIIGRLGYPFEARELEVGERVDRDGYMIRLTPAGFAFEEHDRPGRFDAATARALGIPEGPAWGRLQRGETVDGVAPQQVVGPPREGRRFTITSAAVTLDTSETVAAEDFQVLEIPFPERGGPRLAELDDADPDRPIAEVPDEGECDVTVRVLGTAGSAPGVRRGLPATLVTGAGARVLVDCGEGTQRQLVLGSPDGQLPELDAVLVTHLHLDHWLGLPGLLLALGALERRRPLRILGPPGLETALKLLEPHVRWRAGYHVTTLEAHDEANVGGWRIEAFAVSHRVPALGFALTERADAGRRIVFSGDTRPCQATELYADECDVLVHEATFTEEDRSRARETGHSTARQAAEVADAADVGLLALVHLSSRVLPREVKTEARGVFEDTEVPRDFDVIEVPASAPPRLRRTPAHRPLQDA